MSMDHLIWPSRSNDAAKIKVGDTFGVASIVAVDPDGERDTLNRQRLIVLFACCGEERSYSYSSVKGFRQEPPAVCHACKAAQQKGGGEDLQPASDAPTIRGVRVPGSGPGCGWWPVIDGPMGPRWGNGMSFSRRESSV